MPLTASIRRIIVGLMVVLMLAVSPAGLATVEAQSSDNQRYAAIVVDAASGEVLFARRADSTRYPASLTKMMTLYLTFEAMSQGKVSTDDILTVSPLAASQPPSKLGLGAGQTIRLDDAMRATAVRSANDMAMAIAEHVAGSQSRFAAMSTLKAQQLGMTQTRYVNPNGLPDSRQVTSARDLAILARAIMRDYPQYYSYFGQHDWAYNGRDYRNTNGLLRSGFGGYDGMKTGFTNASGYNLAASAVRDGRRLIVVVLGGRSSASRNAHVAELMDTGFDLENRRSRGEVIQVAQTFFEQRGFGIGGPDSLNPTGGPIQYASAATEDEGESSGMGSNEVAYTALPVRAATPPPPAPTRTWPTASERPYSQMAAAPSAPAPTPAPPRAAVANVPPPTARAELQPARNMTAHLNGGGSAPVVAEPPAPRRATPPAAAPAPRAPAGRWAVQVGAFRDEAVARNWLTEVNRRFRSQFATAERTVQAADDWYRSRFTGLTEDGAKAACAALSERRVTCMVIRPG